VRRIARSSFLICSPSFAAPALYQGATRLPGRRGIRRLKRSEHLFLRTFIFCWKISIVETSNITAITTDKADLLEQNSCN
jgi:hypothetical protein